MPIGPNGEKRPSDPIAAALMIGRISTGDRPEEYVDAAKSSAGRKGGIETASQLTPEQRSENARHAVSSRWRKRAQ